MLGRHAEPIIAVATAQGRGAVGIIRISGSGLGAFVRALCGKVLVPREATYLPIRDADGSAIDRGLAIHFPAPHSYTGEDVLELQVHGGPVVQQLVLARCMEVSCQSGDDTGKPLLAGLRIAQAGEFTQRAFLNDKIDLAQAEAVADLIDASTEAAARSAARALDGEFSRQVQVLLESLIHLRMLVEATLDFPEEEIDHLRAADAQGQMDRLRDAVRKLLGQARQGALLREGIRVVIAGQPNAGKSSLLNALAGAELAIVTPIPGTTRDKVQQTIQIEGVPIHVVDTAGLRESGDEVERIGIERAWTEIRAADIVLFLHDLTRLGDVEHQQADEAIARQFPSGVPVLDVFNKLDRVPTPPALAETALAISAREASGLGALRSRMLELAGWQSVPEGTFIARERHLAALRRVDAHLAMAAGHLQPDSPALDLMAEELRLAQEALGEITGSFTADDLLGEIFSRFCIGK